MRRLMFTVVLVAFLTITTGAATAQSQTQTQTQTPVLDEAAAALRRDPVFVHPQAERPIDSAAAGRLRQQIRDKGVPIYLAVLPRTAIDEAGGDANRVPGALAAKVGLAGTYGVVAGSSFRAGSSVLPPGQAGALATSAFQANSSAGTEAVLVDFVNKVAAATQANGRSQSGPFEGADDTSSGDGGGGGSSVLPIVLVAGAAGGGFYLWRRSKKKRAELDARREEDRNILRAELSVLADDVVSVEPEIALHPEAADDYQAAVARYRVAQAALADDDSRIDLERVRRVLAEGQYAMSRARAAIDGRPPPAPPAELAQPGRHQEPALDLDERGQPQYVGYGAPFYGGGWFGGGGGLLTGLFLGQMLGGWGYGGGHGDQNVYVEDGGSGDGGGDVGGGDWGGGDWGGGGGDFGGGDFGGDIGGGDW